MSKATEWMLRAGAGMAILWFGWLWAEKAILIPYQQSARAGQAEQALAQCRAQKGAVQ